jgi:ABC-type Mn2+/Zn2+ transport system permease subunit
MSLEALLEPFSYGFMREALLAGCIVGAVCAVLSCFLVLKGWSLMGDAVSHAVLPGIVVAYAAGLPLGFGAFVSGLFCALATGFIKANSRVKEDTVMGVVFTGLFALGLVIFTKVETDLHLDHVLFGNILGVSREQLAQTAWLGGVVMAVLVLRHRDLLLFCFDPQQARAAGLNTSLLYYLLLTLLALTIVVSIQAVGIILVIAMLVTPGCVAYLLTDRFGKMLAIAVASAVSSAGLGVYLSFMINGSTGACIVLVQAAQFVLAMGFAPKHGLLAQRRKIRLKGGLDQVPES